MSEGNGTGKGLAGGLMIGCGLLIALVFGACSTMFVFMLIDQVQSRGGADWDTIQTMVLLGFGPFLFGVFLVGLGIRVIRRR